jgi:GNAT superfamily N-acetyltransferase
MHIRHHNASVELLREYSRIPIRFTVHSRLRIPDSVDDPSAFVEVPVEPFVKDYDSIDGEGPLSWAGQFNLENWRLIAAYEGSRLIGGAAAIKCPGIDLLEGLDDAASIWDIRVEPDFRGKGVGARLFDEAETWARNQGCRQLVVETQDINVPACRFYEKMGCTLVSVNRHAYIPHLDEIQLIWAKQL